MTLVKREENRVVKGKNLMSKRNQVSLISWVNNSKGKEGKKGWAAHLSSTKQLLLLLVNVRFFKLKLDTRKASFINLLDLILNENGDLAFFF